MNGLAVRWLTHLARLGNRLPDPVTLFVLLAAGVALASAGLAGVEEEIVQRDGTRVRQTVRSLLSATGVRWFFDNAVTNFTGFAPLGKVLTVMLGIGVAERSGLIAAALRVLVNSVPKALLTATLVFAGVMSSTAADAGYVVLTPLGAVLFAGLGRHPLAGLAAAFAGVSGGYSANLLLTGLDPMLAGLTQEAARAVDPGYTVHAASNYYFMLFSTALITVIGTWVTTRFVEPMLGEWDRSRASEIPDASEEPTQRQRLALRAALATGAVILAGIGWLALSESSPLRDAAAAGGSATRAMAPFFASIDLQIALLFFAPGVVYGALTGQVRNDRDVARMTSETMATMGAYIVLAFAAAQFVAFFNWTHLGAVSAVKGAKLLQAIGLGGVPLLLAFLALAAALNLLVGSASAKWAFMAPIFVPMLMLSGFSPEVVQATYRVGDSVTNIVTPLLPYLPIIIVFARKYDREAGLGTLIAAMLPFSIAFGLAWAAALAVWVALGIPLGPGVATTYP
ncbi:MAG: AbgT family transporter [Proteobacteria bacterium]|nr:AbgT family transporter [Pseudomonadota bacterium]